MQAEGGLQRQDAVERVLQPGLGDDAAPVPVEHVPEVLVGIAEEQEHVAAGGDRRRHQVAALHRLGQADHQRGIGEDQAVEAELAAEQILQQFGGQGGRQDVAVGDAGPKLARTAPGAPMWPTMIDWTPWSIISR